MANQVVNVTIDRLNIRLKGVSAGTAREAIKGLDSRLLERLARQGPDLEGPPAPGQGKLEVGTIRLKIGDGKDPSRLRERVVSGVVDTITAHTARGTRRE